MSISFIMASQLNSVLLKWFSSEKKIYGALVTQSVIVVTFLCSINKLLGLYETIAMLFFILGLFGYI
jgi:DHA1 family bicyclomycin/chloramphenicol resistance-like MFS transporter